MNYSPNSANTQQQQSRRSSSGNNNTPITKHRVSHSASSTSPPYHQTTPSPSSTTPPINAQSNQTHHFHQLNHNHPYRSSPQYGHHTIAHNSTTSGGGDENDMMINEHQQQQQQFGSSTMMTSTPTSSVAPAIGQSPHYQHQTNLQTTTMTMDHDDTVEEVQEQQHQQQPSSSVLIEDNAPPSSPSADVHNSTMFGSTQMNPCVFLCYNCGTIISDSVSCVAGSEEMLGFNGVCNIIQGQGPVVSSDRFDEGCTYFPVNCIHCKSYLGKKYKTTTESMDDYRDLYAFLRSELPQHVLGKCVPDASTSDGDTVAVTSTKDTVDLLMVHVVKHNERLTHLENNVVTVDTVRRMLEPLMKQIRSHEHMIRIMKAEREMKKESVKASSLHPTSSGASSSILTNEPPHSQRSSTGTSSSIRKPTTNASAGKRIRTSGEQELRPGERSGVIQSQPSAKRTRK